MSTIQTPNKSLVIAMHDEQFEMFCRATQTRHERLFDPLKIQGSRPVATDVLYILPGAFHVRFRGAIEYWKRRGGQVVYTNETSSYIEETSEKHFHQVLDSYFATNGELMVLYDNDPTTSSVMRECAMLQMAPVHMLFVLAKTQITVRREIEKRFREHLELSGTVVFKL